MRSLLWICNVFISRYRKYHLFNENGVQITKKPDVITFRTDFNVTFGVFICFDLMFDEPALNLVEQGIEHIVYPTMWFSELPYLTGKWMFSTFNFNFFHNLFSHFQPPNSNKVGHMQMTSLCWRQMQIYHNSIVRAVESMRDVWVHCQFLSVKQRLQKFSSQMFRSKEIYLIPVKHRPCHVEMILRSCHLLNHIMILSQMVMKRK